MCRHLHLCPTAGPMCCNCDVCPDSGEFVGPLGPFLFGGYDDTGTDAAWDLHGNGEDCR
jgi:hypothetical protein